MRKAKTLKTDQHKSHGISQHVKAIVISLRPLDFHRDYPVGLIMLGLPFGVLALEVPQLTLLGPSSNMFKPAARRQRFVECREMR